MRNILVTSLLFASMGAYAQLKTLTPAEKIKASDLNHNFSYIESTLEARNGSVNFQKLESSGLTFRSLNQRK